MRMAVPSLRLCLIRDLEPSSDALLATSPWMRPSQEHLQPTLTPSASTSGLGKKESVLNQTQGSTLFCLPYRESLICVGAGPSAPSLGCLQKSHHCAFLANLPRLQGVEPNVNSAGRKSTNQLSPSHCQSHPQPLAPRALSAPKLFMNACACREAERRERGQVRPLPAG